MADPGAFPPVIPRDEPVSPFEHIAHLKKRLFLDAYAEVGGVREAAAIAGCAWSLHAYWLRTDPVYAAAFEQADLMAGQLMKDEARRRAMGYIETHYTPKGQPYQVYKCSDILLMFRLKARFPEEFREQARKDEAHDISELLKAVLLEMHDRSLARDVTPEADWAPLPPGERPPLPAPPSVDEEGREDA